LADDARSHRINEQRRGEAATVNGAGAGAPLRRPISLPTNLHRPDLIQQFRSSHTPSLVIYAKEPLYFSQIEPAAPDPDLKSIFIYFNSKLSSVYLQSCH